MNNILVKQLLVRQINKLVQSPCVWRQITYHLQAEKLSGPMGWHICAIHTWVPTLAPRTDITHQSQHCSNEQHSEPAVEDLQGGECYGPCPTLLTPGLPCNPTASILALWVPQGSWAALRIQKIPEQPQMNQDLLLSVQGIPNTFQDFSWYLGEEANGGTMLFTYIPKLLRPQRDGSAMNQRDIVGFSNGSMLLRHAQPKDSGTYQVAVAINPSWTMRAKTEVQVAGECWALGKEVGRLVRPEQPPSSAQTSGTLVPSCNTYWLST